MVTSLEAWCDAMAYKFSGHFSGYISGTFRLTFRACVRPFGTQRFRLMLITIFRGKLFGILFGVLTGALFAALFATLLAALLAVLFAVLFAALFAANLWLVSRESHMHAVEMLRARAGGKHSKTKVGRGQECEAFH